MVVNVVEFACHSGASVEFMLAFSIFSKKLSNTFTVESLGRNMWTIQNLMPD